MAYKGGTHRQGDIKKEYGEMRPEAKESLEPPEARRGKEQNVP